MVSVRTTIDIEATPERVWEVLADFSAYGEWNPFIVRITAGLEPGAPVDFVADMGGRKMKVNARMLRADAPRGFRWRGPRSKPLGKLFAGVHYFELEPLNDGRTRFVHGEDFTGLVPALMGRGLARRMEPIYEQVNVALKARVEGCAPD